MSDATIKEILATNLRLLNSIAKGDWKTYEELCDPTLSCFESEARGHVVTGMEFHKFYFDLGASKGPKTQTMASPDVRLMGDVAIVTYIRLVQSLDANGSPQTTHTEETRVWHRQNGAWKHVHFHRSPCA